MRLSIYGWGTAVGEFKEHERDVTANLDQRGTTVDQEFKLASLFRQKLLYVLSDSSACTFRPLAFIHSPSQLTGAHKKT